MRFESERLYRASEVAEILGLPHRTVVRFYGLGKIPAVKMGRLWFSKGSDLQRWFDSRADKTADWLAERVSSVIARWDKPQYTADSQPMRGLLQDIKAILYEEKRA